MGDNKCTKTAPSQWATKTGTFTTDKKCKITFMLPSFHKHRDITWEAHVEESEKGSSRYDMIIGRDLLHELDMEQKQKHSFLT